MAGKTFVLTDGHNLFHRQINMTNPSLGIDNMIGMAFHLIFNSIKKEYKKWGGDHVVFFLEGRSWRKDVYVEYKANRKVEFAQKTQKEQEDFNMFIEAFDDFTNYLKEKTNVSVIQNPKAEADDMIAIWIDMHPDDKHILVSSDSDFFQLLRYPNVTIYDPVKDIMIKQDGVYDDYGNKLEFTVNSTAKIKVGKKDPLHKAPENWYDYALFLKCVRGDKTDNIFSAYPGVREKGTKKTVGIMEAYQDINSKGYAWNNFMLQRFEHHDGTEHRVLDDYTRNRLLIDLSQIPDNVKDECRTVINEAVKRPVISSLNVGMAFMKFCGRWDLVKIGNQSEEFSKMLKATYEQQS